MKKNVVYIKPGMVVHAYNPRTQETKTKGSFIQGQPGLHIKTLSQKKKVRGEDMVYYAIEYYSLKGNEIHWARLAHACNSSYSGGRDQENQSSKPAQANNS
jgi:hypothetical protein